MSDWDVGADLDTARRLAELKSERNRIIEECARVADEYGYDLTAVKVAYAIRALKDKP